MNDIQELIKEARALFALPDGSWPTTGALPEDNVVFRLVDALEALNRENETMTARVVEYLDAHEHPDDWGVTCVYTRGLRALLEVRV